jgi:iduronate 2-sulfatase
VWAADAYGGPACKAHTTVLCVRPVLFFAIDDLRPSLGLYGVKEVKTPNFDALSERSLVFERMYTAVSVCAPARTAILTGRRPDTTHNWAISPAEYWRDVLPNASSLPQYFVQHGYNTMGGGKIFHPGAVSGSDDIAHSWNNPYFHGVPNATMPDNCTKGFGYCRYTDTADADLQDGKTASWAKAQLENIQQKRINGSDTRPFFLGVGFHKPHMPEYCPSKYWDLYEPSQLELPKNPFGPTGTPQIAVQTSQQWRHWLNLSTQKGACVTDYQAWNSTACMPSTTVSRAMRWAYYSCISYTDALLGDTIAALTQLQLADNTVIVAWGDHGWHLGELNQWAKYTNFEAGTRIPFLVHMPGQTTAIRTSALSEANDIFPTIADLAGLPVPPLCPQENAVTPWQNNAQEMYCVEGISLKPLWQNPTRPWKSAAFSQYPRPYSGFPSTATGLPPFAHAHGSGPCNATDAQVAYCHEGEQVMGHTIRIDKWRYTEWTKFDASKGLADWSVLYGKELYSHTASPVPSPDFNYENENVANRPEHEVLVKKLSAQLHAGWRPALPPNFRSSLSE